MAVIHVCRDTYDRIHTLHADALASGQEMFTFEGAELLTSYAKYLLEYMEQTLTEMGAFD